jgi:hypothetical protein
MPEGEGKEAPRKLTAKSAYIALLYAVPVFVVFCFLGRWETGIGAWICSGLVFLVIRTRWDLRKHVWFWMAVAFGFLLQVPIVLLIPWNNRNLTGISLLPVAVLDYGLVYGCVKLVEKMMSRDGTASSPS